MKLGKEAEEKNYQEALGKLLSFFLSKHNQNLMIFNAKFKINKKAQNKQNKINRTTPNLKPVKKGILRANL